MSVATPFATNPYSYPVFKIPEHNGWAISVHGGSVTHGDLRIYPAPQNNIIWNVNGLLELHLIKNSQQYLQLRGTLYGTLSGTNVNMNVGLPKFIFDASC